MFSTCYFIRSSFHRSTRPDWQAEALCFQPVISFARPSIVRPSVRPSVRPFLHYQTCKHDILKTSEMIMMKIGTIGPQDKGMNDVL